MKLPRVHSSEINLSCPLLGRSALLEFFPCKLGDGVPLMLAVGVAIGAGGLSNLCNAVQGNCLCGIGEHGSAVMPICGGICGIHQ